LLPGENHWWLKIYKNAVQIVWQCTVVWLVFVSKTIVQQNRIKLLHLSNEKPLEQKRRYSKHPRSSPPVTSCSTRSITVHVDCKASLLIVPLMLQLLLPRVIGTICRHHFFVECILWTLSDNVSKNIYLCSGFFK